jgi:hypothetical protein
VATSTALTRPEPKIAEKRSEKALATTHLCVRLSFPHGRSVCMPWLWNGPCASPTYLGGEALPHRLDPLGKVLKRVQNTERGLLPRGARTNGLAWGYIRRTQPWFQRRDPDLRRPPLRLMGHATPGERLTALSPILYNAAFPLSETLRQVPNLQTKLSRSRPAARPSGREN